jgi:uncharacterized RDD family membrane protein YckC
MAYAAPLTFDPTDVMGRRIAAWVVDIVVPLIIVFAVGYGIFLGSATKFTDVPSDYCTGVRIEQTGTVCVQIGNDAYVGTKSDASHARTIGALLYLVGAANLFLLQGFTGAALGKHMFGLRVVRADGSIAGFGWNALRTLLLVVDQFFCLPGIITASVTHPHRRIGDFAAGTFVVARSAVGRPIGAPPSSGAYPPPWTPPNQGWGPPPGGQTWGGPNPAPGWGAPNPTPPGWGTPPGQSAPPAWGTPAANPPAAETPRTWGTPPPAQEPPAQEPAAQTPATQEPAPQPQAQPEPAAAAEPAATPEATPPPAAADAPGWAAPAPSEAAPAQQQHQPAPAAEPPKREPQWDAQRNAWVFWEAETGRWLQHDPATGVWGPLR